MPSSPARSACRSTRSTTCSTSSRVCSGSAASTTSASSAKRVDAGDEAAVLAFDVFVHRLKHYVGAYLAHLGRVDVLVFTAGVGQNSLRVRAALAEGLDGLGIAVDPDRNEANGGCFTEAAVISPDGSKVVVAVVPTNEELAIARQTADLVR